MNQSQTIANLTPPKQERSQKTFAAIIDAAVISINKKGFEKTSISDICREAGVTSGAFYARFSGKDDLLFVFIKQIKIEMGAVMELLSVPNQSIDHNINILFSKFLEMYRTKAGILYTLQAQAYQNKDVADELRLMNSDVFMKLEHVFSKPAGAQTNKSFRISLQLALIATLGTLREVALDQIFLSGDLTVSKEIIVREMKDLFKSYLRIK